MRRFLGVVVSVVAALGLVAGPAMAAQALVLSDAPLASVWAGQDTNTNVAADHSTATQVPIQDNLNDNSVALAGNDAANDGSTIDNSTDVDVDVQDIAIAGDDAASGGSTIDNSTDVDVDVLSNVQNGASGLNLSNALLSQVAQQNNISATSAGGTTSVVVQINAAIF